ncbi:response regulator [Bryobacter aggregatus]|uniref:response regulator n=1 Tax=Bryobacter aggregatus TaxID=360054 RepID=UPI0004E16227|nr:response regulator [Bryobacter aggregatus]
MKKLQILLAEDNPGDVVLIQEALDCHHIESDLHIVRDGEAALQYVSTMGHPNCIPCPDALILDINLTKVDGLSVLIEFRKHPECAHTPVIIVTSSDTIRDRETISALGVLHYFRKPSDFDEYMKLGELVKDALKQN